MSEVELTEGIKVIDSKLGTRATFFAHPMCLLSLNGRMTEDNGEVIGMALAWPANFKLEFRKKQQSGTPCTCRNESVRITLQT